MPFTGKGLLALALAALTVTSAAGAAQGSSTAQTERTRILGTTWELAGNPSVHVTFARGIDYANFGCNTGRGNVTLKRNTKDTGTYKGQPWATTRKQCAQDAMDTESHVQGILSDTGTWERSGSTLTITNESGTLTFTARAETSPS